VDRGARFFWFLVVVLTSASIFFVTAVNRQRSETRRNEIALQTGDVVSLGKVIDGDSVIVKNEAGGEAHVRLLGIKSFEPEPAMDVTARFGKDAIQAISDVVKDDPLRVLVHSTPKDKYGRTIATLFVGEEDVGLALVSRGLALVYTVYPFPAMQLYLQAQSQAQAEKKGIWGDSEVSARASALAREWRKQNQ